MDMKAKIYYKSIAILIVFYGTWITAGCQNEEKQLKIRVGAERTEKYFPLIENKNIAIVANHTSLIGDAHLVDSLIWSDANVIKVFSPEHGFRGKVAAGEHVDDKIDLVTGLPIISLYGDHKKPQKEDLQDIGLVIFDIQDVGARFYTYISTMTYVMDACAEEGIPVIILDRPNPNGFYVDGPVMEKEHQSFVGMHPVPIVHGMTVGEYATMVNGEGWLESGSKCDLTVIAIENWTHNDFYELPVKPSPNLPNKYAVYLYPSLCLFEGTDVSAGRGTDYPFQIIGHPEFLLGSYFFVPRPVTGASISPKHNGKHCNGQNLIGYAKEMKENPPQLNLSWLIAYHDFLKDTTVFFNNYFVKLAGTDQLRTQIENGFTEEQIRASWQPQLDEFKKMRKKYLLYPDFE
nr:DUF1343 domain-containing protein [Bacteroidota bacterium]